MTALKFKLQSLMRNAGWKALIRVSVDHYILPGTVTGSEILWIYMRQWSRDLNTFSVALVYLLMSVSSDVNLGKILSSSQKAPSHSVEDRA